MSRFYPTLIGGNTCRFSVWAPEKESMILHIVSPFDREFEMNDDGDGYFSVTIDGTGRGTRYFYRPAGSKDIPDPGSHFQPEGVHGPSEIVDHNIYRWNDLTWKGIDLKDAVIYEIHTGAFTVEGTFEAVIPYLDDIAATGINAIELMPVCQFPGTRNWGYDGAFPYSVHNSYGGPGGLKKLVDECHSRGIAVFLDVVYNHLGPEGNYFREYGPYFTDKYKIPWGDAINLDDEWCEGPRDYFSSNPAHWLIHYHIDGLRVDAIHSIYDSGAIHFWDLTINRVRKAEISSGRKFYMIAESDFNSPRVVRSSETGGYSFDAVWLDDFHHALYVFLHPEGRSRYEDFGKIEQVAKAYKDGFVHSGEMVKFRKRRHGASSAGIPGEKFIVFNQNHDQTGNRVLGERLSSLVGFEQLKLAAAALLLSPYVPLLFMGEEYGEDSPFFYFVNHSEPELIEAVREGRKKEFEAYRWNTEPPDPQSEETFNRSRIHWEKRSSGRNKLLLEWNKELIMLRRNREALKNMNKDSIHVYVCNDHGLVMHRKSNDEKEHILILLNLAATESTFFIPAHSGSWIKLIDSKDAKWNEKMDGSLADNPSPVIVKAGERINAPGWSISMYSGKNETE